MCVRIKKLEQSYLEGTSRGFHFCLDERKASLRVSQPTFQGFDSTCCYLERCLIVGVDFDFYIEHPNRLKLEAVDKVNPRHFKIDVLCAFKNKKSVQANYAINIAIF